MEAAQAGVAAVGLGINPILTFGTDEQKKTWLPDLVAEVQRRYLLIQWNAAVVAMACWRSLVALIAPRWPICWEILQTRHSAIVMMRETK